MRNTGMVAVATAMLAGAAHAAPVNLSTWTAEGGGNWVVAPGFNSVTQTINGNPTVFYGPGNAHFRSLSGTIRVNTSGDDDFIGFVLGFQPGDLTRAATDFIVVDWKQTNQSSFGCVGEAGIALSRATAGLANNRGAWCHDANGVTELQRGATRGATGWVDFVEYTFDIDFTPTNITVTVNGVEELNLNGTFANGRFGFYNYSQAAVIYGAIEEDIIVPPPVGTPTAATLALIGLGLGLLGMARRRR
jgi:hypothetical protein